MADPKRSMCGQCGSHLDDPLHCRMPAALAWLMLVVAWVATSWSLRSVDIDIATALFLGGALVAPIPAMIGVVNVVQHWPRRTTNPKENHG